MTITTIPDRTEAAEYYFKYIDQVPAGGILDTLASQVTDALPLLQGIADEKSLSRYAPDKWSIREVLGHINDTERVFTFRALWFARGFEAEMPSFDQDVAVGAANSDDRAWGDHLEELRAVRAATVSLFRNLPEGAWMRRGLASGKTVSVRALAYITAGHFAHHLHILRERYL